MKLPCVDEFDVKGKRVLVSLDLDLPLSKNGEILNYNKADVVLDTIKYLLDFNAKIILFSYIGNHNDSFKKQIYLEKIAVYFCDKLKAEILIPDDSFGDASKKLISEMLPGSILMLGDLADTIKELKTSQHFAEKLPSLVDIYVNEAFGVSVLEYSSTVSLLDHFDKNRVCVGYNFSFEYKKFRTLSKEFASPFILVVNGEDVYTKIALINSLIDYIELVFVGGKVSNTILKAKNYDIENHLFDKNSLSIAKEMLVSARTRGVEILFPSDLFSKSNSNVVEMIDSSVMCDSVLDIGSSTGRKLSSLISKAKVLLWMGPPFCINKNFIGGSGKVLDSIERDGLFSVVLNSNSNNNVYHSYYDTSKFKLVFENYRTTIDFLQGKPFPAIDALERKFL